MQIIIVILVVVLAIIGHRKLVAGYRAQMFYDRIPIGEPTEKIVYQAKTVDREAVRVALESARQGLQTGLMKGFKLGDIQSVIDRILPK